MDQSIEELRAQRDLIKKHLEWLDRKLAEAESSSNTPAAQPLETSKEVISTEDTSKETTSVDAQPEGSLEGSSKEKPSPSLLDPDPEQLVTPIKNDVQRATIGCIALFILGSGLFLFLLFGLPYLLD
ncbi:MAG: hypothetical protein ACSHX8_13355 [Opitutaceae bacterium]